MGVTENGVLEKKMAGKAVIPLDGDTEANVVVEEGGVTKLGLAVIGVRGCATVDASTVATVGEASVVDIGICDVVLSNNCPFNLLLTDCLCLEPNFGLNFRTKRGGDWVISSLSSRLLFTSTLLFVSLFDAFSLFVVKSSLLNSDSFSIASGSL